MEHLEIVTLSELSQTQKDSYHVFSHMQGLDLFKRYKRRRGLCGGGEGTVGAERGTREGDPGEYISKAHYMHVCKCQNETITLYK